MVAGSTVPISHATQIGLAQPAYYVFKLRPHPKERPRASTTKGKDGKIKGKVWTPEETRAYELMIQSLCHEQHQWADPFEGRLTVFMNFFFADDNHGDIDNLAKAVLDGMQGVAFKNDKQVRSLHLEIFDVREDAEEDKAPRTEVVIMRYREKPVQEAIVLVLDVFRAWSRELKRANQILEDRLRWLEEQLLKRVS